MKVFPSGRIFILSLCGDHNMWHSRQLFCSELKNHQAFPLILPINICVIFSIKWYSKHRASASDRFFWRQKKSISIYWLP